MRLSLRNYCLIVFFYSVSAAIFVQFFALPHLFPNWHAGHGLLKEHDWVTYHEMATQIAQLIRERGWRYWILKPFGYSEVGAMSAMYVFTGPKIWPFIPINAFIHVSTVLVLVSFFSFFSGGNGKKAIYCSLPFAFLPTAMQWVTQVHKDGVGFLGTTLFLYGWVRLFPNSLNQTKVKFSRNILVSFLVIILGAVLCWWTRAYLGKFLSYLLIFFSAIVSVVLLLSRKRLHWKKISIVIVLCWALTGLSRDFLKNTGLQYLVGDAKQITSNPMPNSIVDNGRNQKVGIGKNKKRLASTAPSGSTTSKEIEGRVKQIMETYQEPVVESSAPKGVINWIPVKFLPEGIDHQLYSMACVRMGYLATSWARTNIDTDVFFFSALDMIRYSPRAIQIGLFAPFPSVWFGEAKLGFNSLFRRLVGIEILITYLLAPFALLCFYYNKKRPELWASIAYSLSFILIFALSVPNVGTMHRFRFGFLAFFQGFGILGLLYVWESFKAFKLSTPNFSRA